jgi:hypothetical protein
MRNRDVFLADPGTYTIPNNGVAKIIFPPHLGPQTAILEAELRTFITDGEFGRGLLRILESFRAGLAQGTQKVVWISGFYGSGKSHLAKMLCALWTNTPFADGASPFSLLPDPPSELNAELRLLRSAAERAGGLHAAGGTLGGGSDDPTLATLGIVLASVGLPMDFRAARVAFWLDDEGILNGVRNRLGDSFDTRLTRCVLDTGFHQAVLAEKPSLAASGKELADRLKVDFPQRELTAAELSSTIGRALLLNHKELPLTLVVLDETQEFLKKDPTRVLAVQNIAERLADDFDGRLLLVCTGQQALIDLPQLQKLLGRFQVRINLGEADMDGVIRKTVLRKTASGSDAVRDMLNKRGSEIARQLHGARVAHRAEDDEDAVLDWPLLPSRRRVWERVLRALDATGLLGNLRTQMPVALESARLVADRPLGHAVPADFLYTRFADEAFAAGELPEETRARIIKLREGGPAQQLQARVLMLIYMLGLIQGDAEYHGVRPTDDAIADLLIEDLSAGSDIRGAVPKATAALAEAGDIMPIDGAWRIQTKVSAEWDKAFRAALRGLSGTPGELPAKRRAALDQALSDALKGLTSIPQGRSGVPRHLQRLRRGERASEDRLPLRIYDSWDDDLKSAVADVAARPDTEAEIHLLIAHTGDEADRLDDALRQRIAARTVLDSPPPGSTRTTEGEQAQRAMEQRQAAAERTIAAVAKEVVARAEVLLSAGAPQSGGTLKDRVEAASKAAAVRRYPQFDMADNAGWETVVTRARSGQPDALKAVGHNGSPDTEPVCQAIRNHLGAGRKGKELRDDFEGVPYGWPQDAVDGSLYVLAHAGAIRTLDEAGQEIVLRNVPRQKIGVCRFLPETHTVTLPHKKAIRQLGQTVGIPVTPEQEAEQLPLILERLREAARAAGGDAPAPASPATPDLDTVTQLAGNERLIEAASRVKALQDCYTAWKAAAQTIAARRPAFETTRRLVELGAHGQQAALDDVRSKRRLLEEPDPVPPLRQAAAAELRQRLNAAADDFAAAFAEANAALERDTHWEKLSPTDKHDIRVETGLLEIPRPSVGTPEDIAAALTSRSLDGWTNLTQSLPRKVEDALAEAAARFEPKARPVKLPAPGMIASIGAADDWLKVLREALLVALAEGPVLPRL